MPPELRVHRLQGEKATSWPKHRGGKPHLDKGFVVRGHVDPEQQGGVAVDGLVQDDSTVVEQGLLAADERPDGRQRADQPPHVRGRVVHGRLDGCARVLDVQHLEGWMGVTICGDTRRRCWHPRPGLAPLPALEAGTHRRGRGSGGRRWRWGRRPPCNARRRGGRPPPTAASPARRTCSRTAGSSWWWPPRSPQKSGPWRCTGTCRPRPASACRDRPAELAWCLLQSRC